MLGPWALPLIAGTHRHTGNSPCAEQTQDLPPPTKASPCSVFHIWGGSLPTQYSQVNIQGKVLLNI